MTERCEACCAVLESCLASARWMQAEDENYALALDFCLQKEYYHTFADVNPETVESFFLRCESSSVECASQLMHIVSC